ncbi:MAG: alanine--tRNA ligase [Patescibacteria group bacterium]
MTHTEIRQKFLDFFKARGHAIVPSSSLLPDDPSVLFTTAGMQPMIPYLLGEKHPGGTRVADSQKCFRAQDIEEVGDNRHTTFFEMLGNWSFGDYWKKEQLSWIFEFLTKEIGINPQNLYVTVFEGNDQVPRDTESADIWKTMLPESHIFYYGVEKNWWSRSGTPDKMPAGEPGGPDSEMFYDFGDTGQHDPGKYGPQCHVNCDCGRYLEIGNNVFMEYQKQEDGSFKSLPQKNVDFGGGLERMAAASENQADIFLTSTHKTIIGAIGIPYAEHKRELRIIADHMKAAIFLIAEGATPSNKAQGYIVRRLLRRAIRYAKILNLPPNFYEKIFDAIPDLETTPGLILNVIQGEYEKFHKTLGQGEREIAKHTQLDAKIAFDLYQNHGFPFELTEEIARERGQSVEYGEFRKEFEKHQVTSRAGLEKKFGGHGLLLDTGELKAANEEELKKVTRLHTATHMLQAALRKVLGDDVHQAGSDITAERLRFDFIFPRKMTPEEIKQVEDLINNAVAQDMPVSYEEMPIEEAKKTGALYYFKEKYPEKVKVYSVGDFSKEFCGGPHVSHTGEIGQFKIVKEEAVSTGTRRIRATVL